MKPAKHILNKNFKYKNAASTDIRLTFARIRKEMKEAEERKANVTPFRREK